MTVGDQRRMLAVLGISVAAFYVGDRWGMVAEGSADVLGSLFGDSLASLPLELLLRPVDLSLGTVPLLCGLALFCAVWVCWTWAAQQRRSYRDHDEYGSARLGRAAEARGYRDPEHPENNVVVSRNVGVAITPTPKVRERLSSRNVLVVGGSGTGKTTGYVMPNLLQVGAGRDIVLVDPKRTCLPAVGQTLVEAGIDVRSLDLVDFPSSDRCNPLAYLRTYADIDTFVRCLVDNTNNGQRSSDPIWDQGEELLYKAIVTFLVDWCPLKDRTLKGFLSVVDLCDPVGDGEGLTVAADLLFGEIETGRRPVVAAREEPGDGRRVARGHGRVSYEPTTLRRQRDGLDPHGWVDGQGRERCGMDRSEDRALRFWKQFRSASSKTLHSFVVSAHARLSFLDDPALLELLSGDGGEDELRLDMLGQCRDEAGRELPPRVVFVSSSDYKETLSPLLSILMWQAIFLPMEVADGRCGGRLPRPVSVILDEFKNVGKLPSFEKCIAVARSRDIDLTVIVQSLSQIEEVYGEKGAITIRENCPTTLLLAGGRGYDTAEHISREAGKGTYDKASLSRRGSGLDRDVTRSEDLFGRDVIDAHEVATMDASKAIVLIGDKEVIVDEKARVWDHPRYDPDYMGEHAPRRFDYGAWRAAGRPLGADAAAWAGRAAPDTPQTGDRRAPVPAR